MLTRTTRRRGGSRLRKSTEILREGLYYLPTYLIDDKTPDATGKVSLFVRRYRHVRTAKGAERVDIATDVWEFADADEMLAEIDRLVMHALPAEADGDQLYMPSDWPHVRAERSHESIPREPIASSGSSDTGSQT